jgi:recombinational DNA repair ATPase RecF
MDDELKLGKYLLYKKQGGKYVPYCVEKEPYNRLNMGEYIISIRKNGSSCRIYSKKIKSVDYCAIKAIIFNLMDKMSDHLVKLKLFSPSNNNRRGMLDRLMKKVWNFYEKEWRKIHKTKKIKSIMLKCNYDVVEEALQEFEEKLYCTHIDRKKQIKDIEKDVDSLILLKNYEEKSLVIKRIKKKLKALNIINY